MLTEWCPPLLVTSTVKSSLFVHTHSSPLSLAARLHDVQTILIILTMTEHFLDRPAPYVYCSVIYNSQVVLNMYEGMFQCFNWQSCILSQSFILAYGKSQGQLEVNH